MNNKTNAPSSHKNKIFLMHDGQAALDQVAKTGAVSDWAYLQSVIISRIACNNWSPDVSPTSTVLLPWSEVNRITSLDQMREYLMELIQGMPCAPISIQRLCEVVGQEGDETDERKKLAQIERIIASSKILKPPGFSIRKRSSRGSDGSSSNYSVSPLRRKRRHSVNLVAN